MNDLSMRIVAALKRYGWAVNLAFIFVGSYFVASAASSLIAGSIRGAPDMGALDASAVSKPRKRPAAPKRQDDKLYAAMAARNLFGAMRENLDPVPTEAGSAKTVELDTTNLQKCAMPASLRGTLVADNAPEWSLAVVYVNSEKEVGVFSTNEGSNEIAAGLLLHEIRDRAIVVQRNDHLELCAAEGEGDKKSPPRLASASRPSSSGGSGEGAVNKVSDEEYEVDRSYIDSQLANLSKVATQARIVPSFKNGKANGFKLFSIKPGSIYAKIGMQNGDIIQRINGYEMNSPEKGLEIYQKLKTEQSITVDYLRRGQTKNRTFNIR